MGFYTGLNELLAALEVDVYMSPAQLASYLSVSPSFIEKHLDEIPHFRRGRKIWFRKSEIDQWMEGYRHQPIPLR